MTNRDYTLGSNLSDSSSNINNKPAPAKSSIDDKVDSFLSSYTTKEVESRPESEIDIKTEESKSKTLPKADYLDKT